MPPVDPADGEQPRRPSRRRAKAGLSITAVADHTGLTAAMLRIWEHRYGWPRPARRANGYRTYAPETVRLLLIAARELTAGRLIGEILADQHLRILHGGPPPVAITDARRGYDFTAIPMPLTSDGQRLRACFEQALVADDAGAIARATAEAMRLRPEERERAVAGLLRLAQETSPTASGGAPL
jgi:DNA-binding transcriptional MerR regulator